MILLLDAGNTRLKWAWLSDRGLGEQHAVAHRGVAAERWLTELPSGEHRHATERVLVSNVAGEDVRRALTAWSEAALGVTPEFPRASPQLLGLVNAYLEPRLLGVDRWLALLGAWTERRTAACVVDAGTATKVDAVDAHGRHLGGVIAPGIALMRDALMSKTSDIARAAELGPASLADLLANNTVGAVAGGARLALAGLAERAVELVESQLGVRPALLLTGGDAAEIASAMRSPPQIVPDLVLRGLAALARDDSRRTG